MGQEISRGAGFLETQLGKADHVLPVFRGDSQTDLYDQYHRGGPSPGPEGDQDQRSLYFRHGPAEADLPGYAEHTEKVDTALAALGCDRFSVIDYIWGSAQA